jgi:hypothetical protein
LLRMRARASGPETQEDSPCAIRSSRRSASDAHADSHSGSRSRLARSRSSRRERSACGRLNTSASSTATGMDIWALPVPAKDATKRETSRKACSHGQLAPPNGTHQRQGAVPAAQCC